MMGEIEMRSSSLVEVSSWLMESDGGIDKEIALSIGSRVGAGASGAFLLGWLVDDLSVCSDTCPAGCGLDDVRVCLVESGFGFQLVIEAISACVMVLMGLDLGESSCLAG